MAFCQNCGSQLSAGAQFCTNCGERIAGAAQPSAPPADAAPALHNPALQTPPEALAPPPPQHSAPTPQQSAQHPSAEPPAPAGSAAMGAAAAVGGVLSGMGGQPQQTSAPEPPPQAPYRTAPLPYQPDPHGGAQSGPQAQGAEIKELFFTVQGRLNRKPFLLRGLVLGILSLILSSVMGGLAETSSTVLHLVSLLMLPLILVCAAGSFTLIIRRWHDLGKSGWFTLLLLIPLLNFVVMLYLWFVRGTAGPNAYGEDPLG